MIDVIFINYRENTSEGRLFQAKENIEIDALYGFHRVTDVKERIGFLLNMKTVSIVFTFILTYAAIDVALI